MSSGECFSDPRTPLQRYMQDVAYNQNGEPSGVEPFEFLTAAGVSTKLALFQAEHAHSMIEAEQARSNAPRVCISPMVELVLLVAENQETA